MRIGILVGLLLATSAHADAPELPRDASGRAARSLALMLDDLRAALTEVGQLRAVPHPPAAACLEPVEGLWARVREAQQATLDLQAALALSDAAQADAALGRVERDRRRATELRGRLHACVDRIRREAPIAAWASTRTDLVVAEGTPRPVGAHPAEPLTAAPWPPPPVRTAPSLLP